jgi:hypothetical protein
MEKYKMKKKFLLMSLLFAIFLVIPFIGTPVSNAAATSVGWLDVQPLASGTASYRDVVGGTGDYIYAVQTGSNDYAFLVVSIATPSNPSIVGYENRSSTGHTIHSVDINDDETVAVVGVTQGIYVIDITDKANPNRTSYFSYGASNAAYDVVIVDDLVYCAAGSTGLPVINISDINNPSLHFGGYYGDTGSLWCRGIAYEPTYDKIYAAMSSGYFRVFSLDSDGIPNTQSTIAAVSTSADAVTVIASVRAAIMDDYGEVAIIDTTNLNSPSVLGSTDIGGASGYYGELVYDGTLGLKLLAAEDDTLAVVDFTTSSSPSSFTGASGFSGYGVGLCGSYVAVAGGPWGLFIYNTVDVVSSNGGTTTFPFDDIPGFELIFVLIAYFGLTVYLLMKKRNPTKLF